MRELHELHEWLHTRHAAYTAAGVLGKVRAPPTTYPCFTTNLPLLTAHTAPYYSPRQAPHNLSAALSATY